MRTFALLLSLALASRAFADGPPDFPEDAPRMVQVHTATLELAPAPGNIFSAHGGFYVNDLGYALLTDQVQGFQRTIIACQAENESLSQSVKTLGARVDSRSWTPALIGLAVGFLLGAGATAYLVLKFHK